MKSSKYVYILLIFSILFIPKVYAFSYDIKTEVQKTSVLKGTVTEIKVSLSDVKDTSDGIMACLMNISFDNNISLNSSIKTLDSWSMTIGSSYLFDTGNAVTSKSNLFVIPVKINGSGSVTLSNIACSDGNSKEFLADKKVNFSIISDGSTQNNKKPQNNASNNNNNGNSDNNNSDNKVSNTLSSSADLSNIILSEGTIEFDPAVTEYSLSVSDFNKLEITPVLDSKTAKFNVDRNITNNGNSIVISVTAENGNSKVYTIYVKEMNDSNKDDTKNDKKSNSMYVPIFIGIICVLVIVNIVRIIKNKKK